MAVEEFRDHVESCNIDLKKNVIDKVKTLKKNDTTNLTERVEELKSHESSELSRLNACYTEKKLKARRMEGQVSKYRVFGLLDTFSVSVTVTKESSRHGSAIGVVMKKLRNFSKTGSNTRERLKKKN